MTKLRFSTYNAGAFDYTDLSANDYTLADIAHALAHMPRFGGHTVRHYSVAEHSLLVARLVPSEFRFEALMHDATEAFMLDVPTPLKVLLPDYTAKEKELERIIRQRYRLPVEMSPEVKAADAEALRLEMEWVFSKDEASYPAPSSSVLRNNFLDSLMSECPPAVFVLSNPINKDPK